MDEPKENDKAEISGIVAKLTLRLEQARRVSHAAEACVGDETGNRTVDLLEEVEELVRDANHLVQAALIMRYPEQTEVGGQPNTA